MRSPSPAASRPGRCRRPLATSPARLAWMDKRGIDRQVCGGWVDSFGYELPAAEGEAWSRLLNDAVLAATKAQPRFIPLATVPLQDGARAAAVLKAAMADGLPRRHDRHASARRRQRARRRRPRPVLGGGRRARRRHPHPSELRRRRRAGERLRPRQRRSAASPTPWWRSRGWSAAGHHALQERPHRRSDGRRRPAVPDRPPEAEPQGHARRRRPRRSASRSSTTTASCTTPACCASSSRSSAPTG